MSDASYASIEGLVFGRMAFKGMNPEIERMMENERLRAEEAESIKKEKDVNDEEMAAAYGNLNATVQRKFSKSVKRKIERDGPEKTGEGIIQRGTEIVGKLKSHNRTWKRGDRFKKPKLE